MKPIYKSAEGERAVRTRYRAFLDQWPVPRQELRVPTREGETFVVACGPESAPPVLLLHGSGSNSASWMGDVAAWTTQCRVYAVDMIGEPGFSAPSRPPLDSEAHALLLDDVLQALSVGRVSIVGISLGGWLALDYATRRPEHVRSLALLCPGGVGRQRKSFMWKALPLLLLGEWGRRRALALVAGPKPAFTTGPAQEFAEFFSLTFKHFRPRLDALPVFSDEALASLGMPVLAIVGAHDALLDSADTRRRLERNVLHAEVTYLLDEGHMLVGQTAPILEFLRKHA